MEFQRKELLDRINLLTLDLLPERGQQLRQLKREHNRILEDMENSVSGMPSDILNIFPSEIWIQIIKNALPPRGYSSALLLLTMVSKTWMQALISVPILWAHIEICGSQEDSLATLAVFKHLSGNTPLNFIIYVPMQHEITLVSSILASLSPRPLAVTINQDTDEHFDAHGTCQVLKLLLSYQERISSVAWIQIGNSNDLPFYDTEVARLIREAPLPLSLHGFSGWRFLWSDFQQANDYLQNLKEIESYGPLEHVITSQIHLPRLTSIKIHRSPPRWGVVSTSRAGFPLLDNITSVTYKEAFRDELTQLLATVAPRVLCLELRIPYQKVPILVSCIQASKLLRKLSVEVTDWQSADQGESDKDDPLVLPAISHYVPSLKDLTIWALPGKMGHLYLADKTYREPLLCSFIRNICVLYQNTEILEVKIDSRYSTCNMAILDYLSGLKRLRTLSWQNFPDNFEFSKEPMREVIALESLDTNNPELLCCLRGPNILSLSSSWAYGGKPEKLAYEHVRKLSITYEGFEGPTIKLTEEGFPSLVELTLVMHFELIDGGLSFPSLPMLSSLTIISSGFSTHETALCLSVLSQPGNCPALAEIKFRNVPPDWDTLFLMLEKRNFLSDTSVSRIRRITLPFLPNELCAPLVSLLGGRYTERPSNDELVMGGAQELIFNEKIPGCLACLLRMRVGCREPVLRVITDVVETSFIGSYDRGIGFEWKADLGQADTTTEQWVVKKRSLQRKFLKNLDSWGKKYQRKGNCRSVGSEVEITEYGARVILAATL